MKKIDYKRIQESNWVAAQFSGGCFQSTVWWYLKAENLGVTSLELNGANVRIVHHRLDFFIEK